MKKYISEKNGYVNCGDYVFLKISTDYWAENQGQSKKPLLGGGVESLKAGA